MTDKKRILIVCQYFYPEKISSGILPYEIAVELSKEGYEVNALVGYPKEYYDGKKVPKKELIDNINVKRINYPQFNRQNKVGRILNYFSFCFMILLHFLDFRSYDYCLSYTNPPLLPCIIAFFSKIFHFKYILEIYDLYPDAAIKAKVLKEDSIVSKLIDMANKYSYRNAWKIITLGNECKQYLIKHKNVNKDKVEVIPNWYKKTQTQFNMQPKECDNHINILYGGNMGVMQDMDTILDLILQLKNETKIKFILAGHGNKKEFIQKEIDKNNIKNCIIYDFLPKEEYDQLMDQVDLAIVSLEDFAVGLGSPSKAYSYLSKGIPLIGILNEKMDLYKDIVTYQCGLVKNPSNKEQLYKDILNIVSNEDRLADMRKNAMKLFDDKYNLDIVKKQYFKIFELQEII